MPDRLRALCARPYAAAGVVFVLAFLSHASALPNGFVLDDFPELQANPVLEAPFSLRAILGSEYWSGFQGRFHTGYYRPVPLLIQKLLHDVFGPVPLPYHVTVLLAHALLAALLTEFLRRRCALRLGALLAGALFAVHTANSEAVACSYGLKEVLSGLFPFSALFLYSGWDVSRPWSRLLRLAAASLLLALGVLSKESSLGFFLALPAWDLFRGAPERSLREILRASFRPALLHGCLFAASVFAALSLRAPALGRLFVAPAGSPVDNPLLEAGAVERVTTAFRVAWVYVRILLLPLWLSHDYAAGSIPIARGFVHLDVLAGAAAVAGLTALVLRGPRLHVPAGTGAVIAAASYGLSSNLVWTIGTLFSERFLYLPSIGLALVIAPWLDRGAERALRASPWSARAALAAAGAVLAALTTLTLLRCRVYANDDLMVEVAFRHYPGNASIKTSMAAILVNRHDFDRAERLLDEVERERPDVPFLREHKAHLLIARGRREEGMAILAEAIRQPEADVITFRDYAERLAAAGRVEDAVHVLTLGARDPHGDYRERARLRELRGALLLRLGRTAQALADLRYACATWPAYGPAWSDLAKALLLSGHEDEGRAAGERALALQPHDVELLSELAQLDTRRRDFVAASGRYRLIVSFDPANLNALNSLGGCLVALGDRAGAAAAFEEVLRRAPDDRYALASLGSIEEAAGDRESARRRYERFLASPQPDDGLTRQVTERLARLRVGALRSPAADPRGAAAGSTR